MMSSDENLLAACRNGDESAWETLLDRYERLVYSIPLNYGLSQADAADIAQITFTYFIESISTLRDDSNLAAWLGTVARRHSWRMIEKRKREMVGLESDLTENAPQFREGPKEIEQWEQLAWINHGLSYLTERCRRLLLLLYLDPEELGYEEIAQRMNMAVGSIGPTRARCLEKLRAILQD
jgi:RNA polymerase sigma factor (sigma-70 family)